MVTTLQEAAAFALDVQDACNLVAVLRSFHETVLFLRTLPECTGTDWVNAHPVAQLFASKVHSLTGMGLSDVATFCHAYDDCRTLAGRP